MDRHKKCFRLPEFSENCCIPKTGFFISKRVLCINSMSSLGIKKSYLFSIIADQFNENKT